MFGISRHPLEIVVGSLYIALICLLYGISGAYWNKNKKEVPFRKRLIKWSLRAIYICSTVLLLRILREEYSVKIMVEFIKDWAVVWYVLLIIFVLLTIYLAFIVSFKPASKKIGGSERQLEPGKTHGVAEEFFFMSLGLTTVFLILVMITFVD